MSSSRHASRRTSCCGQTSVVRLSNSRGNTETVRCRFTRPCVGIMMRMRMTLRHLRELVNLQFQRNIRRARVHPPHEERDPRFFALLKHRKRPFSLHRVTACLRGLLTPDYDPGALTECAKLGWQYHRLIHWGYGNKDEPSRF